MWAEDCKWHYDYVRLAWDTGFSFDKWKSPNLDKNKICVVDIDRIVKERDVASVDRYISIVVQYILDDEQAKVLDINFVKIFRLSQLAVEFLLFCKKYLDNTVVLLKKELSKNREENKELKIFIDDLQSHIDTLTRQQALATFKCSTCSKAFSSEEYLNAHIKRRHSNQNSESYNVETDKLNLEIKELKERLNNTEKLLIEKEGQNNEKILRDTGNNDSKMDELLDKFEKFKEKVDMELRELRMQKSFYEENYGKLFDIMINNKENVEPRSDNIKETAKAETTTQTDKLLHIENVQNRNVVEIQDLFSPKESGIKSEEVSREEKNSEERKENLEAKISTTLAGIEDQMQAFWNKLNEIEHTKTAHVSQPDFNLVNQDEYKIRSEDIKPKIRPRSKLSQPTHYTMETGDNAENLKLAINNLEQQHTEQKKIQSRHNEISLIKNESLIAEHHMSEITNIIPKTRATEDLNDDSKSEEGSPSESESSVSESFSDAQKEAVLIKPLSISSKEKRPARRCHKVSSDKEVIKNLNKEIKEVVYSRIQELGISKSWTGIPQRSFEKSLEILNHQAALTKRTYAKFDSLKKKLDSDVEKQCNKKTSSKINLKTTPEKHKTEKTQNVVKISYRPKPTKLGVNQRNLNIGAKRETVEIKNRALYESDTESEKNVKTSYAKVVASTSQPHQIYSEVLNEFKSLSSVKSRNDEDSDIDDLNKKEDLQKGVLKSFPSVGSLSKKKVLFDLDSDSSKKEDAPIIQKVDGSTTSIASSILEHSLKDKDDLIKNKEESPSNEKKDNERGEKDVNELSDFDFSDL